MLTIISLLPGSGGEWLGDLHLTEAQTQVLQAMKRLPRGKAGDAS